VCHARGELQAESDRILDAARSTVLDFGLRRATVTEVARRAGLSRITVYRRYADGGQLVRALMMREFGKLLAEAERAVAGLPPGRRRVVGMLLAGVQRLGSDPLFVRLLELEPETLIPYLIGPPGRFQVLARRQLAKEIAAAQRAGEARAGDPGELAAAIETAARGITFAARGQSGAERQRAQRELGRMVDAYLRPLPTLAV
jgi:AcrR family transcriptional regulator